MPAKLLESKGSLNNSEGEAIASEPLNLACLSNFDLSCYRETQYDGYLGVKHLPYLESADPQLGKKILSMHGLPWKFFALTSLYHSCSDGS